MIELKGSDDTVITAPEEVAKLVARLHDEAAYLQREFKYYNHSHRRDYSIAALRNHTARLRGQFHFVAEAIARKWPDDDERKFVLDVLTKAEQIIKSGKRR